MLRSRFSMALLCVMTFLTGSILSARSARADYPTLSTAGRYFGWGWGKGYHTYDNCGGNCYGETSQVAAPHSIPTQSYGHVSQPQPAHGSVPLVSEPVRSPSVLHDRRPEPSVPNVSPARSVTPPPPVAQPMNSNPMIAPPMETAPGNPMNPKIPVPGAAPNAGGAEFLPPPRSAQRPRYQQPARYGAPIGPWADYGR